MKRSIQYSFLTGLIVLLASSFSLAQNSYKIKGVIRDKNTRKNIEMALVGIKELNLWVYTNKDGEYLLENLDSSDYTLHVSFISYKDYNLLIKLNSDIEKDIYLSVEDINLKEVVVTARESKSLNTSSKIRKDAISHLQASSFSELMEFLPGNSSKDPHLGRVNMISMRQVGSDVNTSLGTSFIIDGAPVSNDANMQSISGSWERKISRKNSKGLGIDTRTISTDDIESIEIIRGIPSVKYGDLTSGLINIKRKSGESSLKVRVKSDPNSKLMYVGKGFSFKDNSSVNLGIDYLKFEEDPRNPLVNYKRITSSIRYKKSFNESLTYKVNLDYTGSFDDDKEDKEINYGVNDYFSSSYNSIRSFNEISWNSKSNSFLKSINWNLTATYTHEKQIRDKLVSNDRDIPWTTTRLEGESDGIYLPNEYQASMTLDAKPVNVFSQLNIELDYHLWIIRNRISLGSDFKYDKNFGKGELFNFNRPVYISNSRPRAYMDVPSSQRLSFFIEDDMKIPLGDHSFNFIAGLRSTKILNLSSKFSIAKKIYLEPRINIQWSMPRFPFLRKDIQFSINAGVGEHTRFPVLSHLYPNDIYYDLIQLNYYHQNVDYRRLNFSTHKINPTNYNISEATNRKWEIGIDLDIEGNSISVTAFKERLNNGFISQSGYKSFAHKKYDNASIDYSKLTDKPQLEDMTYKEETNLYLYSQQANGSLLQKKGIEFSLDFKRIKSIYTKLTISGAWFKTLYSNNNTFLDRSEKILNGQLIEYIGEYQWNKGKSRERFNTNFRFDTQVPQLGMIFSALIECQWFLSRQMIKKDSRPISYIDKYGHRHPFTDVSAKDYKLKWLIKSFNNSKFLKESEPFAASMNLKLTKRFNRNIRLAIYVNRILTYLPVYKENGLEINRRSSPYFGMELNLSL